MNKIYRDKSIDNDVDKNIAIIILKMFVVWILPIILIFIIPLVIFDANSLKDPSTIQNKLYTIIILLGFPTYIYYLYKWNRENIYILGNKSLYFIDDGDSLYYANLSSGQLGDYIKHNVKLTEKVKYTPSVILYAIVFFFRTFGMSKLSFLKQQLYFKMNLKKHFCEDILNSKDYKLYSTAIYSIKNIKNFRNGIEVNAIIIGNGKEYNKTFYIYDTTENFDELKNRLYSMKENSEFYDGINLDNEKLNIINKVIYRKILMFLVLVVFLSIIIVIRYLSYKHDIQYNFFLMDYLASINIYKSKLIIGILVILIVKVFGRNIYDLFNKWQFTYKDIEIEEFTKLNESKILNLVEDFKTYAWIKYNDKIIKVGVYGKKNKNSYLILRNNIPYCLISK